MYGECHGHMILDGIDFRHAIHRHKDAVQDAVIHRCLAAYRKAGIDFVRDGGDHYGVSVRARELAPVYGIDYRTPVFAIHKYSCYGQMVGRSFSDRKEYRELIKEVRQSDGDFVKVMLGGILDFGRYGIITGAGVLPAEMNEMVHIAHEEGFAVMAHVNGADDVKHALLAGVDSVEHGFYMDRECLEIMAANRTVWVPTLSPAANQIGEGRFPDEVLEKIVQTQMNDIRTALDMGVVIAAGSDAGAYRVPHVAGLMDEIDYLRQAAGNRPIDRVLQEGEQIIRKRFIYSNRSERL